MSIRKLSIFGLLISLTFVCCSNPHNPQCAKIFKNKKAEKNFSNSHKPILDTVSVYVENSGSMDGYVNGNTEFKTDLFNILKLLGNTMAVDKNFINSDTIHVRISDNQFSNGMSISLFKKMGGNRGTSNIAELIEKIIEINKKDEVSVFVSDCVFDPESDPDIEKRLAQQKTTIKTAIKRKLQKDSEFSVMVYRLMSTFSGTYYNKVKPHSNLKEVQRPYFIWFFGDFYRLKKVRELLASDIETRTTLKNELQVMVQTNEIKDIPYFCPIAKCANGLGKHIEEAKEKNGKFNFIVRVDYSTLPYNEDYLMNKYNYVLPDNKNYEVSSVKKCTKGKGKYTHELKISKTKGNIKNNTLIKIELKRPDVPNWVKEYNDPRGDDILKGIGNNRTFGLKSYLDGVHEAFDGYITTFTILIK